MRFAVAALSLSAPLLGCGGARQDAHEPSGNFPVSIVSASFPSAQTLSRAEDMKIAVRNEGTQPVPDVAVTVNSFDYVSPQQGLADPSRPIWIVDQAPIGGESAYVNTWTLGGLAPGQVRTFSWRVTPVLAGTHRIDYRIAAGLNDKAHAQLVGGGIPQGSFTVNVADLPSQATVDPGTGRVVRHPGKGTGPSTISPGPPAVSHGTQGPNDAQPGTGDGSSPGAGAGGPAGRPVARLSGADRSAGARQMRRGRDRVRVRSRPAGFDHVGAHSAAAGRIGGHRRFPDTARRDGCPRRRSETRARPERRRAGGGRRAPSPGSARPPRAGRVWSGRCRSGSASPPPLPSARRSCCAARCVADPTSLLRLRGCRGSPL